MHLRIVKFSIFVFASLSISVSSYSQNIAQKKVKQPAISIAAVGDVMLGSDYPTPALPPQNGKKMLRAAGGVFAKADIRFANLEGTMFSGGVSTKRIAPGKSYAYRMPENYVEHLVKANVNVVSLSNNHSNDFGVFGANETKRNLSENGIIYSSKKGEVAEFEIQGKSVGLIALSFGDPPRSISHPAQALQEIKELSRLYDILIVSVHSGAEGEEAKHTKNETENYLGENRGNVVEFSRAAIDAGASIIIHHGAHVPRAMEVYNQHLIIYGLGNFATYGMLISETKGVAPLIWVNLNLDGTLQSGKVISMRQDKKLGTVFDPQRRAGRLIRQLSHEDFPNSYPRFNNKFEFLP